MLKCVTLQKCQTMSFLSKHLERDLYPHCIVKRYVFNFKKSVAKVIKNTSREKTNRDRNVYIFGIGDFVSCHTGDINNTTFKIRIGYCMTLQIECNSIEQKTQCVRILSPFQELYLIVTILLLFNTQASDCCGPQIVVYSNKCF